MIPVDFVSYTRKIHRDHGTGGFRESQRAINGKNRVSEETRARVMAAAQELSFTPNPIARPDHRAERTVGVIIADRRC
jgi:Bacterial regulatory proteins, lacI family